VWSQARPRCWRRPRRFRCRCRRGGSGCWACCWRRCGSWGRALSAVPPAGVKVIQTTVGATPGDHLTARPYCCVGEAGGGCVGRACGCPTVGARIVSAPSAKNAARSHSAPDNHLTTGPHRCVSVSGIGGVGGACGYPSIRAGIVSAAAAVASPAPDDHFVSSPYCCVTGPASRSIDRVRSCPTVCSGIISSARI